MKRLLKTYYKNTALNDFPQNVIQLNRLSKKTLVINSKSVFNAKKLPRHPE